MISGISMIHPDGGNFSAKEKYRYKQLKNRNIQNE